MGEYISNKGTRQKPQEKKKKNEVKISKLPSKEFEIMIIKMLNNTQEKNG